MKLSPVRTKVPAKPSPLSVYSTAVIVVVGAEVSKRTSFSSAMFFPSGITEEVREVPPRLLIDVDPILSTLSGSEPVVIPAVIANETVIAVPASVALNVTSSPELSEATKVDPA